MPKLTDEHFPTLQKRCQAHPDHRVDESPLTQTNQPAATLKQVDVADLAAASPGSPQAGVLLARWYNPALRDRWSTTAPLPGQRRIVQAGSPRDIWRRRFCCRGCRRRCRCLYGTNTLRCRKCLGFMYASQSDRSGLSALRRANAIRCCLGEIDPAFPPKPLHMRWRTYEVLRRRYNSLLSQFFRCLP